MKNTKNTPEKQPERGPSRTVLTTDVALADSQGEPVLTAEAESLIARIKASRKGSILTDAEYLDAVEEGRG